MRTPLTTLTLLALLAATVPTPVLAQEADGPLPLLEDPAGDVMATLAGNQVPLGGPQTSAIDLRSLTITEDPASFHFDIQVEDLGGDNPRADWGAVQTFFDFGGVTFILTAARSEDNAAYFGNLYRATDSDYAFVRGVPMERDLATSHLWTTLDRFDLKGSDGQVPGRGDELTGIWSAASAAAGYIWEPQNLVGVGPWIPSHVGDIMPDAGSDPGATWTVQFGGGASEGASITTPQPFRASNGEATTYLYTITARHDGDATARYQVSIDGLPEGWNATLPGTLIELPAGVPVEFPLYVQTTFNHRHGTAATFQVHLHEDGGERWAMTELGVNFLSVPQPAGHHPDLWLHSNNWGSAVGQVNQAIGGTNGFATMNTLEQDPADTGKPVYPMSQVGGVGTTWFRWSVCLEPSLLLGLDFDLAGTGAIQVPIHATKPLPGATLSGRLVHLGPGEPVTMCFPSAYADREQTVLADLAGTAADIDANGDATLEALLTPLEAADYIAAQEGAGLVLELELTATGVDSWGSGGPMLMPGAHLQLPLLEYHDAIQVVVPEASEQASAGFVDEDAPAKDAPGAGLGLSAMALVALALLRRRA